MSRRLSIDTSKRSVIVLTGESIYKPNSDEKFIELNPGSNFVGRYSVGNGEDKKLSRKQIVIVVNQGLLYVHITAELRGPNSSIIQRIYEDGNTELISMEKGKQYTVHLNDTIWLLKDCYPLKIEEQMREVSEKLVRRNSKKNLKIIEEESSGTEEVEINNEARLRYGTLKLGQRPTKVENKVESKIFSSSEEIKKEVSQGVILPNIQSSISEETVSSHISEDSSQITENSFQQKNGESEQTHLEGDEEEEEEEDDQVDKLFQQLKMKAEQEWKQIEQLQMRLKEISTEVQEFVETSRKSHSTENVGDFGSSSESEGPGSRKQSIDDDTAASTSESETSVTYKGILKSKSREKDSSSGKRRVSFFEPSIIKWKGGLNPSSDDEVKESDDDRDYFIRNTPETVVSSPRQKIVKTDSKRALVGKKVLETSKSEPQSSETKTTEESKSLSASSPPSSDSESSSNNKDKVPIQRRLSSMDLNKIINKSRIKPQNTGPIGSPSTSSPNSQQSPQADLKKNFLSQRRMSMTNVPTKQTQSNNSTFLPIFPGVTLEVRSIVEFQMSAHIRNQLGNMTRMRSSTAAASLKSNK